ncbi:MAG: LPS assembly lipoprotein LptE [Phycisphaerales bacterium JB040]
MTPRQATALLAAATLAPILGGAAGCARDPATGYTFRSTYDTSVRTVAVPVFDNATMEPGLGVELTDAVAKEIQRATPWRVAARASADTELLATVTGVSLETLSEARASGLSEEQAYTITVRFEWRDARTGRPIVARRSFSASATSIQARPTSERVEVGRREAVEELARDIVRELRSTW